MNDTVLMNEVSNARPVNLNISFAEYFKVKFESIKRGISLSEYIRQILSEDQDDDYYVNLDKETLELFRKLSSYTDDIDYSIVWGGDGFWKIEDKK